MGRPPKDPAVLRNVRLMVNLTAAEAGELAHRAAACGLPPGVYLRQAALGAELPRPVPPINRTAWIELSRLAGNFNQLAHQANSGAPVALSDSDLREAIRLLRYLRQDLRGE